MKRVLVTGASGFVASALLGANPKGNEFVAASRQPITPDHVASVRSPDLTPSANWGPLLDGVDAIVHLAARVHLAAGGDTSPYFLENSDGTAKLARDALSAGVQRFVFLSTSKVLGDESGMQALSESASAQPTDAYAASKLRAEQALTELHSKMQVTIIRPPLVYGPGVKANFLALLSAVEHRLPLPLSRIQNRRSLIGVHNLATAILACLDSPILQNRTYHVTDGPPISTPSLVRAMALALSKPARLFPFPPRLLEAIGLAVGRAETIKRLTRSLELDDTAIREELGWTPIRTLEEGLAETAAWYVSRYAANP